LADYEDPGWRPVLRNFWPYLIPYVGYFLARRKMRGSSMDSLTSFRLAFVGLVFALLLFGYVLLFIVQSDRWWSADQSLWFLWVALAVAGLAILYVQSVRVRSLDVTSLGKLAATYRGVTFTGLGAAASPAFVSFIGVFIMGNYWIYLVGLAVSVLLLLQVGPTHREIARRQEQISYQGSSLSLVQALLETPPPGWNRL
jgi:heme exporter protein D